jgi:hypothetical protein
MLCLIYLLTFLCIFGDNNQHLKYNISFEDIWNRTKDICLSQWFIMLQVYELMKKNQSHHAEWKLALKMIYLGQILSVTCIL